MPERRGKGSFGLADERQAASGDLLLRRLLGTRSRPGGDLLERDSSLSEEPEPLLLGEHARDRLVEPGFGQPAARHRGDDRRDGDFRVGGHQDDVAAGFEDAHGGLAGLEVGDDASHRHGVREDEAVEAHLLAQELRRDAGREGRRERPFLLDLSHVLGEVVRARRVLQDGDRRRVEGRNGQVRGHDAPGSRFEAGPERDELDRVEPCAVEGENGEGAVRVGGGVAVPGEVLQRRQDATGLEPLHGRRDEAADGDRLLAEAPHVDDGVVGVVVHVGDRGEDDVDAEGAGRLGRRAGAPFGEVEVSRCGDGHRRGAEDEVGEAHPRARLEVGRDQERHLRLRGEAVVQVGRLERGRDEPDDAADPLFGDEPCKVEVFRVVLRAIDAARADHDDLPRLLAEGERGDGRGAAGERGGRRGGRRRRARGPGGRAGGEEDGEREKEEEGRRRSGGPSRGFPAGASRRANHRLARRGAVTGRRPSARSSRRWSRKRTSPRRSRRRRRRTRRTPPRPSGGRSRS